MKFVAAYLLANLAGNPSPTKDDVRKILDSVGAEVEEDKLKMLFREVEGKDVAELLVAGREKFAFIPCSGAAADAASTSAAATAGGGGAAAEEKKKEEKAEEKAEEKMEEEEDDNMFSLFDD